MSATSATEKGRTAAHPDAPLYLAHKARFVEYDMPADFLDAPGAIIAAFKQSAGQQTSEADARVTATTAPEDALGRGEQGLERLDTAVRDVLGNDAAATAAWMSARRLKRTSARRRGAATSAPAGSPQPGEV